MKINSVEILGTVNKNEVKDEEQAILTFKNAIENTGLDRQINDMAADVGFSPTSLGSLEVEVEDEDEDSYYMRTVYSNQEGEDEEEDEEIFGSYL